MKKKTLLWTMVVICAMFFTGMTANQSNAQSVDIKFTGFCDGMKLNFTSGTIIWGKRTGCRGTVNHPLSGDYSIVLTPKKQ